MQNYYSGLVLKIDALLLAILFLLSLAIIVYLFARDFLAKLRKNRLIAIKNNIYELLLSKPGQNTCPKDVVKITSKEFIDIVTNRSREAAFFNQNEQEYIRHCYINQNNILKIQRVARKSKNKWHRIEAMLALSFTEAPCALALFEKGIFDRDTDISYFSMLSLGRVKTNLSLKILLAFMKKNPKSIQKVAAMLETFPASACEEIIKLADDKNPEIRFWVLKLLSRLNPGGYFEKIKSLSLDKYPNVRAIACECLGNIAAKEAQEILIRCLKDESWLVRSHAVKALSNLMGKESVKYIVGLLSDNSLNVIGIVKEALISQIDTALPYLEKILMSSQDDLAKRIVVEILATGDYTEKIIRSAALEETSLASSEMNLLAALMSSGAYYSIEAAFLVLNAQERENALIRLREINEDFAEQLAQKIKGTVK